MPYFIYAAIFGYFLSKRPLLIRAASPQKENVQSSFAKAWNGTRLLALASGLAILAILYSRFRALDHLSIWEALSLLLQKELLLSFLGFLFGFATQEGLHSVLVAQWVSDHGDLRKWVPRVATVFFIPGLVLLSTLFLSSRVSKLDTKLLTLEFEALKVPNQRQVLIDLRDPVLQLKSILLGIEEIPSDIEKDIDISKSIYGINSCEILNASLNFHREAINPIFELVTELVTGQKRDVELVRLQTRRFAFDYRAVLTGGIEGKAITPEAVFGHSWVEAMRGLRALDLREGVKTQMFTGQFDLGRWPTNVPTLAILRSSPYCYIALAHLCWFNNDWEGALEVLRAGNGIASKYLLSSGRNVSMAKLQHRIMYYSGRSSDEMIGAFGDLARTLGELIDQANSTRSIKIARDYETLLTHVRSNLGYVLAEEGKSDSTALAFTKKAYEDIPLNPRLTDSYAYVLLAHSARETPPDVSGIERARRLLKEAQYLNQRTSNAVSRAASSILIEHHIRLAETLLKGME